MLLRPSCCSDGRRHSYDDHIGVVGFDDERFATTQYCILGMHKYSGICFLMTTWGYSIKWHLFVVDGIFSLVTTTVLVV